MRPVLGVHAIQWNNDALSLALEAGGVVKTLSPSPEPIAAILDRWPDTIVIGRRYFSIDEQQAFIDDGTTGGKRCANQVADHFSAIMQPCKERKAEVYLESVNEPPLRPYDTAPAALTAFTQGFAEECARRGARPVILSLSVGQPEGDIATRRYIWERLIPALYSARAYSGAVGLHAYGAPTMQTAAEYYTLRYQVDRRLFWPSDLQDLPIALTEVGIDAGVLSPAPPSSAAGWRSYATPQQYAGQLRWYRDELAKDPYVIATTPFTSGATGDWADFSLDGVPELAEVFREQHTIKEVSTVPFSVTINLDAPTQTSPNTPIVIRGSYAPARAEGAMTVIVALPMSDDNSHAYAIDPVGFVKAQGGSFEASVFIPKMDLPHAINATITATFTGFMLGDYGGGTADKTLVIRPIGASLSDPTATDWATSPDLDRMTALYQAANVLEIDGTTEQAKEVGHRVVKLVDWFKAAYDAGADPFSPARR